ncbi:MAG TPA: hypothetical protein VD886_17405, partial [Herpetosiphonaceae bacterium]|nr:hypothetical protein [Herpetosiphonaceae bacterium]
MLDSWLRNGVARCLAGMLLMGFLIPVAAARVSPGGAAALPPVPAIADWQAVSRAVNTIAPIAGGYELQHPTHVARFTERGVAFAPKGGGPTWRWRLAGIRSSGGANVPDVLQAAVAPARLDAATVGYERAGVIERYVARAGTIEQQFVVAHPLALAGGDLVIAGTVESAGEFDATDHGWRWRTDDGGVRLGDVYAFDAAGAEIPVSMTATAAGTRIVVDGRAMAGAAYPITIDPQIGPDDVRISAMGPAGDASFQGLLPDVAYNPTTNEYLVVWHGDHDIDGKFNVYGQ